MQSKSTLWVKLLRKRHAIYRCFLLFFAVVAVINDQALFKPVIDAVLHVEDKGAQLAPIFPM
ncbi:hypothetical protein OH492_07115 [Vibrio chagasii]|nr:hypothetical protein [Vibrio chagasii]